MKRLSLLGFVVALASVFAGCPLYNEDDPGSSTGSTCTGPGCDDPNPGPKCASPSDCGINETCGKDGFCHVGDCTIWGCVGDLQCTVAPDKTVSCEPAGSSSSSSSSGGQGGAGQGGAGSGQGGAGGEPPPPPTVYCGNPDDCAAGETCAPSGVCTAGDCAMVGCIYGYACGADGTCRSSNPAACSEDLDCSGFGAGYRCVSGICTAPADQCSDQTQCPPANKCADGKCTAACASDAECPGGYTCDVNLGVCTVPALPCVITNDCGGPSAVCVDGACVPRSANGSCPAGSVWVDNGCIPTQSATFFCIVDGQQDSCAAGSLCLHHNCYVSCEPPDQTACDNLGTFNVCKDVTTVSGAHKVCGSNQNLGSDCDPTLGAACSGGKACIDGYCK